MNIYFAMPVMEGASGNLGSGSATALNIHSLATFVPIYDGSYPIQDFLEEIREAAHLGSWPDKITLKVAKSKLNGSVAEMVRNRHDLNHAETFTDFSSRLVSALHTDRPVSVRLQDLMTCVQQPSETVDAYATRIRQKSKGLTEWDVSAETKELKNKTVTATFLKGLQPNIRQHVLPFNPPDFEAAIALARSQEINASLVPLNQVSSAATSSVDSSLLDIQKRVASLELTAAQNLSERGRGRFQTRGRGRGRQPPRKNFNNTRSNQRRYESSPPQSERRYRQASCHGHCCCSRQSRSYSCHHDRPVHSSRSPRYRYERRNSRSPYRNSSRRSHSRSPSASPSRSRYQSPKGYRSRH